MKKPLLILFCILSLQSFSQLNYDTTSLLVRFNFKLLDWDVINNTSVINTSVEKILSTEGYNQLEQIMPENINLFNVEAKKVFPMLQVEDSISISRHGEYVTVPPFWATFRLEVPENIGYYDFVSSVYDLYPVIIYTDPNYHIELTSLPNDTLFNLQNSIWDNGSLDSNINVEGAWEVTTGRNFIKVGVFDTGIDTTHEDIEVLTGWSGHQTAVQIGSTVFISTWGTDDRNHGTKSAGIIAARRNNDSTGIAGIAGGDGSDTSGVSLLDFRYSEPGGADIALIEDLSTLIMDASRSPGSYYDWTPELNPLIEFETHYEFAPGYGINLANNSYAYRLGPPAKNEPDPSGGGVPGGYFDECNLCKEAFLFSLKNGVINVASSGNKLTETGLDPTLYEAPNLYPASYDDSWTIRVGASQQTGEVLIGGVNTNDNWFSVWSENVDVIAPGQSGMIETTWGNQSVVYNPSGADYGSYFGTSAAAPHVTGIAALLLSHYNKPCYSNINLDIADVEYILQKSAVETSYNTGGQYHPGAGWGRVDATAAMDMIDYPVYQIVHPIDTFINQQTLSVDTIVVYYNKPLNQVYNSQNMPQGSYGPLSSPWPLENFRPYKAVRYKEQLTYDFSQFIQDTTELLDTWVRHSQTNSLGLYNDTTLVPDTTQGSSGQMVITDFFDVEPMASIDSVVNDSLIYLSGYYYHFIEKYDDEDIQLIDSATVVSENHWYPINPFVDLPRMAYTIYLRDSSLIDRYDFDCDSLNPLLDSMLSIDQTELDRNITIFPNPASSQLNISLGDGFGSRGVIKLVDLSGRIVDETTLSSSKLYRFDISRLKTGIYFVNLTDDAGNQMSRKWIKQ